MTAFRLSASVARTVPHPRVALAALVLTVPAIAGCGGSSTDDPQRSHPSTGPPATPATAPGDVPPPVLPAPSIARDIRASFGVLRRPRRAADRLPAAGRRQLRPDPTVPDERGANPRFSRRATGQRIWVVPGRGTVCLVYIGGGMAGGGCASTEIARRGRLLRSVAGEGFGVARGRRLHYGLVPDGVRRVTLVDRDGRAVREVPAADNVWSASAAEGVVRTVRVGDSEWPVA